jgi:hypothetical protein
MSQLAWYRHQGEHKLIRFNLNTDHPCEAEIELAIRIDQRTKGVEEPTMAIEFLLVLLLEAEEDLDGTGCL